MFVRPIVGEGGKDFTGEVILIDQFKRKHPTDEPPKPPTPGESPATRFARRRRGGWSRTPTPKHQKVTCVTVAS